MILEGALRTCYLAWAAAHIVVFTFCSAAVGQERVLVWDPNAYHAGNIQSGPPVPKNATGETLAIFGLYAGQPAEAASAIVAKDLSPYGYVKGEFRTEDSCKGKWVIGEGPKYTSEVTLRKSADTHSEEVRYEQNYSYSGTSFVLQIVRTVRYGNENTAVLAPDFLAEVTKRYGAPYQTTAENASKYPTNIVWGNLQNGRGISLSISYFSSNKDRISSFRMTSRLSDAEYAKQKDASRYLCPYVDQLDKKRQAEVDKTTQQGAPKF